MRPRKTLAALRPGSNVVTIDHREGRPPRVLFSGEDLLLEDLPVGTRVIYPKPPMAGLPNRRPPSATRSTTRRTASRCTRSSRRG